MQEWTTIIKNKSGWRDFNIKELVQYKDLIYLFVKRNFTVQYKQTILGPIWFIINPLLTTFIYTFIFGGIAGVSTDGVPQFAFYLTSYAIWNYFATCITQTSNTFTANAGIFGKVYFPRLTMPISTVIFSAINFVVVFIMALGVIVFYAIRDGQFPFGVQILLVPVLVVQAAILGLGFGVIVSSLTTKYRDLAVLVSFGVQLWMYATPVVYPVSEMPKAWRMLIMLNPVSPIVHNFRYAVLGSGELELGYWGISAIVTVIVFIFGVALFNKVEKTFMDTV